MKKMMTGALIIGSLLLSACAQSSVKVSDSDMAIIRNGKKVYSKQDLFEEMKGQDYGSGVVGKLASQIATKEGISEEELQKLINNQLQEIKALYKDNFKNILDNYGGEEKFKEILHGNLSQDKLLEKYLDSNLETYTKEYMPIKAQIAYFDNADVAQDFIKQVKAGANFAKLANEKGYALNAEAKVYTDKDTDVVVEVKSYFNDASKTGLSDALVTMTSIADNTGKKVETARYYVVNILERDVNQFKAEFISLLKTKVTPTEALSYYFGQHEVRFHDQRTYDLLAQTYTGIR